MAHIHTNKTTQALQHLEHGLEIANRAVVCDIESECVRVDMGDSLRWYDTRPMVDPREHSPDCIDMATQALHYGEQAGLIERHPAHRHLVRVTQVGQAV